MAGEQGGKSLECVLSRAAGAEFGQRAFEGPTGITAAPRMQRRRDAAQAARCRRRTARR